MVENRQKGITKAYRNDKKDNDTSERASTAFLAGKKTPSFLLWTERNITIS